MLGVDSQGLHSGNPRVMVSLHLNEHVRLSHRFRVSLVDVIKLHFRYEQLFGRYLVCSMINHGGLHCPRMVEAEAAPIPPPPYRPKMVFRAASSTLGVLSIPTLNLKVHDKKVVTILELPEGGAASTRVSVKHRQREEASEDDNGKMTKHSLSLVPFVLQPKHLGFTEAAG
ncbi:hypothetical protein ACLB2K_020188 [Fragaria x ananassa]